MRPSERGKLMAQQHDEVAAIAPSPHRSTAPPPHRPENKKKYRRLDPWVGKLGADEGRHAVVHQRRDLRLDARLGKLVPKRLDCEWV